MAFRTKTSVIADTALLGLRGVVGGYVAAHGAQKLFGAMDGPGLEATGDHFEEDLDLAPGREMAAAAGTSELVGGVLTAFGLGGPLGPMSIAGSMATAALTAHRGKGPFNTEGGPELPITNIAVAAALALIGPGRFSADRLLRTRPSKALIALAIAAGTGAVAAIVESQAVHRAERELLAAGENPTRIVEPVTIDLPVSA